MAGFLLLAPGPEGPVEPPAPAPTTTTFTVYLSRGDRVLPLTGQWQVQAGAEGLDDPTITPVVEDLPGLYGEVDYGVAVAGRDVFLPLLLTCETGAEWEQARRDLRAIANPLSGLVTVGVVRPDGTRREITGRAVLRDPVWSRDLWSAAGWQRLGVLVHCTDPWWRTPGGVDERWISDPGVPWFGTRIDALPLAPEETWGEARTVTVGGDVDTYPTLTITAPGVVTVESVTLDRSWQIDCTGLALPVTVVTDPRRSAVTDATGADQWDRVAAPADLWPLTAGDNSIRVTAAGASSTTTVLMSADTLHMAAVA